MIGTGCVVLLAAAVHNRNKKLCKGLEVNIHGVSNNFFIDEKDVKNIISSYAGHNLTSIATTEFNLVAMERELKRDVWIKDANLFFDNNDILQANVEEREPVARVFAKSGNSFYIDNTNMILPVSDKLSARLPVFTGFPTENKVLSKPDSSLLNNVRRLSELIQQDSFLMAMIEQVDITADRNFEMIPKIGDQVIVFGDASNAEQKFKKLQLFYKKVMTKYGWNRYSIINLQYKGQVIGKIKGKDDISADSLRTVEIMHAIAIEAARKASDSLQMFLQDNERNTTNVSIIEQSIERDDEGAEPPVSILPKFPEAVPEKATETVAIKPTGHVAKKPVEKKISKTPAKPVTKPAAKPVIKPAVTQTKPATAQKKPATTVTRQVEKPKAVMPKKNEY